MITPEIQQIKQRFGIIGNSPALIRAITRALQVAPTDLSVLVTGESGAGKEFFPKIVHMNSSRKHGKYIAVNCGAIPEGTIDSELFGHEKGSFTGALTDRKGYFEEADGGTIFLDEVAELPLTTQARLLRVLESGEFIKVGSSKVLKTNVRTVAATNMNMERAIADGKFREDLFFRLNTVPIEVPPLRDRAEDIYLIFRKFSIDFAERYRMPAIQLNTEAKNALMQYHWPGNIRQLKNITEQISIFETTREVTADILHSYLPKHNTTQLPITTMRGEQDSFLNGNEREMLYKVIFELRKELNDLKGVVHNLANNSEPQPLHTATLYNNPEAGVALQTTITPPTLQLTGSNSNPMPNHTTHHRDFAQAINDYEEEPTSLEEVERELIIKALERNNGKRKKTADELKISERTLYRKIKEYNLE